MLRLFIFFFHSLIADVIIRENGNSKKTYIFLQPYLLREKGMSKNDGDSDDDIGSVKFSFFLYTFSQIEERPILESPLATHGSLRTGSWAYPPSFKRISLWITSLGTTYILRTETTDAVNVALDDLKTLGTCDGYTPRGCVCV